MDMPTKTGNLNMSINDIFIDMSPMILGSYMGAGNNS